MLVLGGVPQELPSPPPSILASAEMVPPLSTDSLVQTPLLRDAAITSTRPVSVLLPSGRIFILFGNRSSVLNPSTSTRSPPWAQSEYFLWTLAGSPPSQSNGTIQGGSCIQRNQTAAGEASLRYGPCDDNGELAAPAGPSDGTTISLSAAAGAGAFFLWPRSNGGLKTQNAAHFLIVNSVGRDCVTVAPDGQNLTFNKCIDSTSQVFGWNSCMAALSEGSLIVRNCTNSASERLSVLTSGAYFEYPRLPTLTTTASSVLLPLDPANGYQAEVLLCGGSVPGATKATSATSACAILQPDSPDTAWRTVDPKNAVIPRNSTTAGTATGGLLTPRVMGDLILLPDGTVLLLNGCTDGAAGSGLSGTPNLQAELYIPSLRRAALLNLTSSNDTAAWVPLNSTQIPRLYGSTVTLLPDGRVMVTGSSADADTSKSTMTGETRVEYFSPPYLTQTALPRPVIGGISSSPDTPPISGKPRWSYNQPYTVNVSLSRTAVSPASSPVLDFSLYRPALRTGSRGFGEQLVWLQTNGTQGAGGDGLSALVSVVAPPTPEVAPPGWYLLFAVVSGIPSVGQWIQIGSSFGAFSSV
ncbi:hypothetical protein DFJ73DRAFT_814406 [Zopfochytrium polystomum]|nr:hypothetical protein DFJ73DRAFT_814406 [Zopfochytrium polystomum]